MKIQTIRVADLPITSPGANSLLDIAGLVTSAVAVTADVPGKRISLTGYGFASIGRRSVSGILRDRLLPRLLAAPPDELLDDSGLIDSFACWQFAMRNEKPGGHGDRAAAMGALDMALWDLRAKAEDLPLFRLLAKSHREDAPETSVAVYAAGGYYAPGDPVALLRAELQGYLDRGYLDVKIKIGGMELAADMARVEAAIDVVGDPACVAVDANGRWPMRGPSNCSVCDDSNRQGIHWVTDFGPFWPNAMHVRSLPMKTCSHPKMFAIFYALTGTSCNLTAFYPMVYRII